MKEKNTHSSANMNQLSQPDVSFDQREINSLNDLIKSSFWMTDKMVFVCVCVCVSLRVRYGHYWNLESKFIMNIELESYIRSHCWCCWWRKSNKFVHLCWKIIFEQICWFHADDIYIYLFIFSFFFWHSLNTQSDNHRLDV